VTPLGVDESWFRAKPADASTRQRIGLPAQYLVAVGTLEPRKNLATLIAAYRRLIADGQPVRPLVLVGPAGWGEALELSGLPVGTVLSTGYLDQADLQSVVAGSAGLIFPSLYEGFGLPPLEALATGRPVIASDSSVSREVLGNQAVLVTAQDPDGLAIAISRLPSSESPSDAAVAARREWAARWTWDNCAAAWPSRSAACRAVRVRATRPSPLDGSGRRDGRGTTARRPPARPTSWRYGTDRRRRQRPDAGHRTSSASG